MINTTLYDCIQETAEYRKTRLQTRLDSNFLNTTFSEISFLLKQLLLFNFQFNMPIKLFLSDFSIT